MRTGNWNTTTGVWRSDCSCRADAEIRRNDPAPPCPVCAKPVVWTYVRATLRPPPGATEPFAAPRRPPTDRPPPAM
jgi:hypothetical protein